MADGAGRGASPAARKSREMSVLDVEALYSRLFMPLVRRAWLRKHLRPQDAFDIVQEAFALALVKMSDDTNPRAWLTSVVDNLAANFKRKSARRYELERRWMSADSEGEGSASSTDEEDDD